jgi:hypothetical protein
MAIGAFELLHGCAELVAELPVMVSTMGAEQVASAAGMLRPDSRAVLMVEPLHPSAPSASSVSKLEPASGSSVSKLEPASGSSAPGQEA